MSYYSKSGISGKFFFADVRPLTYINPNDEKIEFYWTYFDRRRRGIRIDNCLDKKNIELLKVHANARLHLDFAGELIFHRDIQEINNFLNKNCIPRKKVFVYVQDKNQKEFFQASCLGTIIITYRHYLKQNVNIQKSHLENKKFSLLVRRHTPWRFKFIKILYNKKILKSAHWSYLGIDNKTLKTSKRIKKIEKFSRKLPKKLKNQDYGLKFEADILYQAILASQIYILVETVYDQKEKTQLDYYDFAALPIDVSEKAFKAIICKKPFIAFATPYWLEGFRNLGFKTFSPFIDESYDKEEDDNKRLCLICTEIERLNRLPQHQLDNLVNNCEEIVNHNYSVWKEVYEKHFQKFRRFRPIP